MSNVVNDASSSIISTSYHSVTHKKNIGTLILNDTGLTFYPVKGESAKTVESNELNNKITNVATPWIIITKHQVSPVTHTIPLLKIVLLSSKASDEAKKGSLVKPSSLIFLLKSREELERVRKDISTRLITAHRIQALNNVQIQSGNNRKRNFEEVTPSDPSAGEPKKNRASSFIALTDTSLTVTRSSLLSSDPTLRMQHSLLVLGDPPPSNDTVNNNINHTQLAPILSKNDFWSTHKMREANHTAKIRGTVSRGLPSTMKSSLDLLSIGTKKPIHLGVEEMRQIFILYPAVHKAYEAMVPLELSEEQFWRKYLESEYFHRDRGRMGTHFIKRAVTSLEKKEEEEEQQQVLKPQPIDEEMKGTTISGNSNGANAIGVGTGSSSTAVTKKKEDEVKTSKEQEENARVAAASSNDIFSRAELELYTKQKEAASLTHNVRRDGKVENISLAVGQFDLAATANTERGSKLLLHSNDLHRPLSDETKGGKVIEKYNRHWAIVMNPKEATAGCSLIDLARKSVDYVLDGDEDAKVAGGVGKEMERLVGFANAKEGRVDHVKGVGDVDSAKEGCYSVEGGSSLFEELKLQNISAYSGVASSNRGKGTMQDNTTTLPVLESSRRYVTSLVKQIQDERYDSLKAKKITTSFPEPKFGRELLLNLTKVMKNDSLTESDTLKMTNQLDENFRKNLTLYFRRATELLRHFFALRRVMETEKRIKKNIGDNGRESSEKIAKIVKCMEQVYREMEKMRNDLPSETMREMCFPIMDQLDFAFKLSRDTRGSSSGGGFFTVED